MNGPGILLGGQRMDPALAEHMTFAVLPSLQRIVRPVALSFNSKALPECEFGTAQVVRFGDEFILITAAHNVVTSAGRLGDVGLTADPELCFNESTINWLGTSRPWAWADRAVMFNPATSAELEVDRTLIDVAAIELTPDEVDRFGFRPIEASALFPTPIPPSVFAVVFGYPTEMYDTSRAAEGIVRARWMSFTTQGADPLEWHREHAGEVGQVIKYPERGVDRWDGVTRSSDQLPKPPGISGSTIWTVPLRSGKLSTFMDLRFCGLQHSYLESRGLLFGNNAQIVIDLVGNSWPNTRPLLEGCGFTINKSRNVLHR